jgi:P-type Cu2+ transporter
LPKKAHKLINSKELEVDVEALKEGDIVLIKPGEKVPADGIVLAGGANVNEALISGESKPIKKNKNNNVVAGSICLDGSLTVRLTRVGEHSTIGQIQKLIAKAQNTKPRSQRIADKASAGLTFIAGITALMTIAVWTLLIGEPFVFAVTLAITVLVIACPHALGLAIPTVTTITTSLAVKNGIFLKDLSKIEIIRKADYIVFDKTGTLTEGTFSLTGVSSSSKLNESEVLSLSASIDSHSSHVVAQSIVNHAKRQNLEIKKIDNFQNIAGKGASAQIDGQDYFLGNETLMQEKGFHPDKASDGSTIVFLANKTELLGLIKLSDKVKKEAHQAVDNLHKLGVKVAMLTGDNEAVAQAVASELKIDTYFAQVLPEDKYKHIKKLQGEGNIVLMVGDGVNDAPALTQSDAGVAIGAGTDVAVEAGDVVLTKSNPLDLYKLISLSRKVYRKMIQNLIWALGYNIIAIPAAAGVFAYWGFFLRPEIGALVMSLSTVIVVANAMTLKLIKL